MPAAQPRLQQPSSNFPFTGEKESLMPLNKLKEFLDANNIKYRVIVHSKAYTAQEIASLAHIPGQELAKTVMVMIDDNLAMAVLPASEHVDLAALKSVARANTIRLATEFEFKDRFPQCEAGAMPPFGNLYDMAVYAERGLEKDREIAFNAGSHTELVQLALADFMTLVKPRVASFSARRLRPIAVGEDRTW
jgi:Ala-tRNA(Pro) deacylase